MRLLPFERVDLMVLVRRLTELKAMLLTESIPITGFIFWVWFLWGSLYIKKDKNISKDFTKAILISIVLII